MEAEETDGHTPRLQGSLGRRHLPLRQEPGRKEMEKEGPSLFPATSVGMASPAPCRPCREEVDPGAGPDTRPPRSTWLQSFPGTDGWVSSLSQPGLCWASDSGNSRFLSLSFPFSILDFKQNIIKIGQGRHRAISLTQRRRKGGGGGEREREKGREREGKKREERKKEGGGKGKRRRERKKGKRRKGH